VRRECPAKSDNLFTYNSHFTLKAASYGKRGRGRGNDQIKWPNAYFEQPGYYRLEKAHVELCNPHQ
jgi:hypothetical protein